MANHRLGLDAALAPCDINDGGFEVVASRRELAQLMAAHESPRTTAQYDRRDDEVAVDEVEKILINYPADSPGYAKSCFLAVSGDRFNHNHWPAGAEFTKFMADPTGGS
jgi:hypothetical protein